MPPGLFWIAYSERERQQALDVTRAFQQRESRDELGLGSIRDGIADLFFPGTSTLQTRARYFLFVPWAYQQASWTSVPAELRRNVRHAEARLIYALLENCPDAPGLIGRISRGALERMPSALYWQGLEVWGIRKMRGTQAAVERAICRSVRTVLRDDDGDVVGGQAAVWNLALPPIPDDHPESAELSLTFDEADFLLQQLSTEIQTVGSILALLATEFADHQAVEYVWEHPKLRRLPQSLQASVEQARRFSLTMQGAAWLYNIILAEYDARPDLAEDHRRSYERWARRVEAETRAIDSWDLGDLWELASRRNPRIPWKTQQFVERWVRLVCDQGSVTLIDNKAARDLIIDREQWMKQGNARTRNARALKQWGGNSGTAALDFRWSVAQSLISDIRAGLENNRAAD